MDDTKEVAAALQALVQSDATARTKMGRLRQLLPEIEAAQAAGISHEQILVALNERGFDLKMGPYSTMLWRIRNSKPKGNAALPHSVPVAQATAVSTPGREVVNSPSPVEAPGADSESSEAMDTKRRREEKARRFITDSGNPLIKNLKGNK